MTSLRPSGKTSPSRRCDLWPQGNPAIALRPDHLFEFDHYPEGLDAVEAQLRRQHISTSLFVRRQYTAADRRQAELPILGPGVDVDSVEGTLRWEDVSIFPFCDSRTADWQFELLQIIEQPQGAVLACVDHWPMTASADLAQTLRQAGGTGLELVPP